jgi:hypothetical protein
MAKAFVDTTVLTDATLKTDKLRDAAKRAMGSFDEVLLASYALKEFKAGPLRAYVWFHNKVVSGTWSDAVRAIPTVMTQKNFASTAIGALADFESSIAAHLPSTLAAHHPHDSLDVIKRRESCAFLRKKVLLAWRDAKRAPYQPTNPLSCFAEVPPSLNSDGTLENRPTKCTLGDCCLVDQFGSAKSDTLALREKCAELSSKREMARRRKVLERILRSPNATLSENECRSLGDAVFALQCPGDAVILTTNLVDHGPLAQCVGKRAQRP